MATVDEILTRQAYAAGDETWTKDNNYLSYTLYVEPEYVPVTNKRIADFSDQISVRGEQNAQFVGLQLPRYDDGLDLTATHLYIHYQTVHGGSDSVPCNVSKSDNYVRICWQVPAQATQEPDRVQMMIYATGTNSMGERVTWKTLPASYTIHDGLDIGGGIPEPDPSWYEQFVQQMEAQVSTAQGHANDAQASKTAAAGSAKAAAESAAASAQAMEDNKAYVESQKETFVGYNRRETDTKYANALIGTASGVGRVTVEDAWEAPVTDMEVLGRSEQVSTTGAQLLDCSKLNKSAGGAVVNYGDGGYSISGTGTLTASFTASYTLDIKNVLKPGNLILKSELTIPKLYIRIWDGSTLLEEMQGNSTKQITQEMIDNENVRVECFLYGSTGSTITPGTYYPMLYQDGDGTWEPYTGAKPSPSPEYPQPIISTGTVSTGAQLFDASKIPTKSAGGATVTNNGNGSFTISGNGALTGTFKTYYRLSREEVLKTFRPGIYTLSADVESYPKPGIAVRYIADNSLVVDFGLFGGVMNKTAEITQAMIDDESLYFELYFYGGTGTTIVPGTVSPMLNAGDTPKPWEPYTGGKPSPSPDYPQTMDVMVTGANLVDSNNLKTINMYGVTINNNGDGSFTVKGTATGYVTSICNLSLSPGTYTVSGGKNKTQFFIRISKDGQNYSTYSNSFEIKGDEVWVKAYIQVDIGMTADDTIWPMLNAGSTALPWQPYQSCTASITLTEPLRGIGDYRDTLTMTKRINRCVEMTMDGGEDWSTHDAYSGFVATNVLAGARRYADGYCNQMPVVGRPDSIAPDSLIIGLDSRHIYARNNQFYDDTAVDKGISAWKAHLAAHPLVVVTYLDTPVETDLDASTVAALAQLTTYTGTTHINITAGGLEPDVGLEYVQDTRAAIADLQAQINAIRNGGTT